MALTTLTICHFEEVYEPVLQISTLYGPTKDLLNLVFICVSFDRKMCRWLATILTLKFEKKEEDIREGTRKLYEKKRLQAEKNVKRTRDKAEKENSDRY